MAEKPPISFLKKEKIMKRKNFNRFINRKALLIAGLIALVLCMTFTSCDLPEENEVTGITLNKEGPISIAEKDIDYLYVKAVTPANAPYSGVVWTTSDPTVATVDNGIITTLYSSANKSVVITAKIGQNAAASRTFNVTAEIINKKVTDVNLNQTTLSLTVGGTATLIGTTVPTDATNNKVFYTSSNPSVAKVDGDTGVVTAVSEGIATITVTTKNVQKTKTCTVTVSSGSGPGPGPGPGPGGEDGSVSLNKTSLTLMKGKSETLAATIVPSGAAVTWTSSDTSTASVVTGNAGCTVTGQKGGTATITVKLDSDNTKTATCTVTVIDPATYFGTYTGTYYNTTDSKDRTEVILLNNTQFYITDTNTNPTPESEGMNDDFLNFTITAWELATTPASNNLNTTYPIALKISGKIKAANPTDSDNIYGTATASGFVQSDIDNATPCWMYLYISNDGKFIRSAFSKGTGNNTAPVTSTKNGTTTNRIYTKKTS